MLEWLSMNSGRKLKCWMGKRKKNYRKRDNERRIYICYIDLNC